MEISRCLYIFLKKGRQMVLLSQGRARIETAAVRSQSLLSVARQTACC